VLLLLLLLEEESVEVRGLFVLAKLEMWRATSSGCHEHSSARV
jgi:hypothetical protein